jgi:hypothetical protein
MSAMFERGAQSKKQALASGRHRVTPNPLSGPAYGGPLKSNDMPQIDTDLARFVEEREPDLTWRHLFSTSHEAPTALFQLHVCRESHGQLRIFIFKDREFVSYIIDTNHDVGLEAGSDGEVANTADLLNAAIRDIESNDYEMY